VEILQRLDGIEAKFEQLAAEMAAPQATADPDRYRQITKTYSELERIVLKYRE
jgi:protein subunit release factor A